ncbi:molybdate ABC transporter substrate-binding protein [Aquisalimonas sp.]|uniref:molybdate ABC transporter substrate-binding protein n=1 Tax=Aquisalimonas sp. TaxID=1872621 RepID=UPI0025C1E4F0|nr:molybdate ABC transporter substrate-binding protein [Aquisalimonas sp.]
MVRSAPKWVVWLVALLLTMLSPVGAWADRAIVAAASDLQFALEGVAERFEAEHGQSVRLNFGSSGNFRRQIAQGAPFELYLSADEAYVMALYDEGHTVEAGVLYALGRLVFMAPADNPADVVDGSLRPLRARLEAGELRRIAIANPEHAPYGVAAREALQTAGIWDDIKPYLIYGENDSQAARLALSGEADGGLVAYSLALAPALKQRASHDLLAADMHAPLRQRMVLTNRAGETARAFYAYMQGEQVRAILAEYGFVVP